MTRLISNFKYIRCGRERPARAVRVGCQQLRGDSRPRLVGRISAPLFWSSWETIELRSTRQPKGGCRHVICNDPMKHERDARAYTNYWKVLQEEIFPS